MGILVTGATSSIGKLVVKKLLEQNYQVRALVKDVSSVRNVLGDQIELFALDITNATTITPEVMQRISQVVYCPESKVQPSLGVSPELLESEGMKNLLDIVSQNIPSATKKLIFDFMNPNTQIKETWGAVDDVVMGGVSQSNIRLADGKAIFSGIVSTDNNGGFASVRTRNFDIPLDLSAYEGIELKVIGDGKRYKFITRCEGKWDGIGYSQSFDTVYNFPTTIRIPFKDLIPVFRAKTVTEATKIDASKIYSMQLMLSKFEYDGRLNPKFEAGSFVLQVESISVYGGAAQPQFVQVISTEEDSGESIIQDSGMNYTIIRSDVLTEKQEDNLTSQANRDAIAQLCIEVIRSSQAVNQTFEVQQTDLEQTNGQSLLQKLTLDI